MKWLKSRKYFLSEAKIKDLVHDRQREEIIKVWGERYLEYEEVDPTENIKQGKWKLDEEDRISFLNTFFKCDVGSILSFFEKLDDNFAKILSDSVDLSLLDSKDSEIFKNFDSKSPTIDQISRVYGSVFRKLSVGETKSDTIISRDSGGRPIMDNDGNMVKISKVPGDPIFSKSLVNILSFITEYNFCYPESEVSFSPRYEIDSLINITSSTFNQKYEIGNIIFSNDIYLSIQHNPKAILNISISKFYSSCQDLYSGGYRKSLLGNVFDPNTIPAFIIIETPITMEGKVVSDVLPLTRTLIRSIESYDSDSGSIYFDLVYPSHCQTIMYKLVKKYSGNENSEASEYIWFADLEEGDELAMPYMDTLSQSRGNYIGANSKDVRISGDMRKYKISPRSKIKSLMIDTNDLPSNFFSLSFDLERLKFNFLKLNDLSKFTNVKTESIYLNKCSLDISILKDLEFKDLSISGCEITGKLSDISRNLNKLEIIYTLDSDTDLESFIDGVEFESLVVSRDLADNNKSYLSKIKNKVTIKGPSI